MDDWEVTWVESTKEWKVTLKEVPGSFYRVYESLYGTKVAAEVRAEFPLTIFIDNYNKDPSTAKVMEARAVEMLSHETLHGVFNEIGEPDGNKLIDKKVALTVIDSSGIRVVTDDAIRLDNETYKKITGKE